MADIMFANHHLCKLLIMRGLGAGACKSLKNKGLRRILNFVKRPDCIIRAERKK